MLTYTSDRLIAACSVTSEDPVALLTNAAQDHIPIDPMAILAGDHPSSPAHEAPIVPAPKDRESIKTIIENLKYSQGEDRVYRDQAVYERVFDLREPRWGEPLHISTRAQSAECKLGQANWIVLFQIP